MSKVKLQIKGGSVNPGSLGPALGGKQLNIRDVQTQINGLTENRKGELIRVIIHINDKTKEFSIEVKDTPAPILLKRAAKIEKGSSVPNRDKVATLSYEELKKIAQVKQKDLNAFSVEAACQILAGTARSMGITITQ